MNNSVVDYLNSKGQASDFNSRASLATKNGIQNYTGTADQNLSLLGKLQTPASQALGSTQVSTAPDAGSLAGQNPLKVTDSGLGTATTAANGAIGAGESLNTSLQKLIDEQTAAETEAKKNINTQQTKVQALLDKQAGKADAQAQAEQDAGLGAKKELYNNLTTEYQTRQLGYNQQYQAILNQPGLTREQANQQIDELTRQHASTLTDISIRQAIAGNQYNTAQELVNHKIDVEYGDLKDQITEQEKFLEDNRDDLSKAQQTKLELNLEANKREYDKKTTEAKTLEDNKLQVLQQAAKNGADSSTLTNIQKATTIGDAIKAAGATLQGSQLDTALKQAQIDNIYNEIKERGSSSGLQDPSQVLAYAQQYASTGAIPTGLPKGSFGLVSQVAKELPKPDGTIVDNNTGIKSGKVSSTQEDGLVSLFDLIHKLDSLKTDFQGINTGFVAGLKNAILPSPANQQYNDMKGEVTDLLARARTGAAISESELKQYEGKLPGNFTKSFFLGGSGVQKIDDLKSSLEGKLQAQLKANGLSIYGYSTVNIDGKDYTVGSTVSNGKEQGRVNPDGTITIIK